jgi:hypothetical protein
MKNVRVPAALLVDCVGVLPARATGARRRALGQRTPTDSQSEFPEVNKFIFSIITA